MTPEEPLLSSDSGDHSLFGDKTAMTDTIRVTSILYDAHTIPAPTSGDTAAYIKKLEPLILARLELGPVDPEPARRRGFKFFGGSTVLELEGAPTHVLYQGYFAGGRALVTGAWRQAD